MKLLTYVAFEKYGRNIKPHGQEWKHTFQQLMVPYIHEKFIPTFITLAKDILEIQVLL
jgi:predicted SprT family Zn-dependent metalloprotease